MQQLVEPCTCPQCLNDGNGLVITAVADVLSFKPRGGELTFHACDLDLDPGPD